MFNVTQNLLTLFQILLDNVSYNDWIDHQVSCPVISDASSDNDLWDRLDDKVDDNTLQDMMEKMSQNAKMYAASVIEVCLNAKQDKHMV